MCVWLKVVSNLSLPCLVLPALPLHPNDTIQQTHNSPQDQTSHPSPIPNQPPHQPHKVPLKQTTKNTQSTSQVQHFIFFPYSPRYFLLYRNTQTHSQLDTTTTTTTSTSSSHHHTACSTTHTLSLLRRGDIVRKRPSKRTNHDFSKIKKTELHTYIHCILISRREPQDKHHRYS